MKARENIQMDAEREEPDDTDVKESDSRNKDPFVDEDLDHHITIILRNDPQITLSFAST